jgi:TRAP transporter TAXI family solute receptor
MKATKLLCSAILGSFLLGGLAHAQPYNLTLTGASPGGLWSRVGGGLDAAIAAAYPGSTITYQTSSGGLANVPMVASGKVPMGIATDGELAAAVRGSAPFKAPVPDVNVLLRAYTPGTRFQATHVIVNKDFADKHGIASLADLVAKKPPVRLAVNRRGNMDAEVGRKVLAEAGITEKGIEAWGGQWIHAASKEMVSLTLDRRIDMFVLGIAFNHPRIREVAQGITPVILDIPAEIAAKVAKETGGEVCTFGKDEYKFSTREINSVCVGALVVVKDDMDDALAYNLAKGLITQIDKFKEAHRLLKKVTKPESIAQPSVVAPFHPGSARYFREAGLMN